jgi:stalled ribosome rescue protein Dom34
MSHRHAIVWLDHFNATIIDFSVSHARTQVVDTDLEHPQVHRKSGPQGSGHLPDDHEFYARVATAIGDAAEVIVTGPGVAKISFKKFLDSRFPAVAERVVAVETTDHPTAGQLLAFARQYFRRVDSLLGDG